MMEPVPSRASCKNFSRTSLSQESNYCVSRFRNSFHNVGQSRLCRSTSSSRESGVHLSMSMCKSLQTWILCLWFLLSTHKFTSDAAEHYGSRIQSGALRRELLAHNDSRRGLSQDEATLLSWKTSSASLAAFWNGSDDQPCAWSGVGCANAGRGERRVTALNLMGANLTGAVPPQIFSLTSLTFLSLSSNNLTGAIPPELANCINLKEVNFTNNNLTGDIPVELGRLAALQELDLSRNQLKGLVPAEIFSNCTNLVYWNISSNKLTGALPDAFALCTSLRTVDVGNNNFTGEIPASLGRLPLLQDLIMADNNGFNGSIPATLLANCGSLSSLDIAWNSFSGPLPSQLGACTSLEMLIMQGNRFTGAIPDEFGRLNKLRLLALGNNNLTGVLPEGLRNCSALELLDVGNNQFHGVVPAWLGELSNLRFVTLQINQFSGTIPVELAVLPALRYLDLSVNYLHGGVPVEFGRVGALRLLRLSGNNLTGVIPAELGNITYLQGLDLSSNFLSGEIPASLGNLRDLLWLQLGNNTLTGEIPSELTNCGALLWVNLAKNCLQGPIPDAWATLGRDAQRVFRQNQEHPWILNGVGECSVVSTWSPGQLQHFNKLLDTSDPQKCHSWLPLLMRGENKLRSSLNGDSAVLSYWQLGRNKLNGSLPRFTMPNATSSLGFLILSENRLSGPIPVELGSLPLYNVNLSQNYYLNGSIPAALGNASLLVTLDLAYNDLSGALPPELGDLYALTVLNVSYNRLLSGTIPSKGQFTTLGLDPYMGDINLCFNDTDPMLKNILDNATWTNGATDVPPLCSEMRAGGEETDADKSRGPTRREKIMRALTITFLSSLSTLVTLLLICTCYCVVKNQRKRKAAAERKALGLYWEDDARQGHGKSSAYAVASFGTPFLQSLTYAHLAHATENFSPSNIVGDGGFGVVYRARLASGATVAIKKLVQNGAQGPREFLAEMETLGTIQHENLVSLLGYCCTDDEMLLVYEYFARGSLDDWLYESDAKAAQLTWPLRLRIALETARGLAFLHHQCAHLIIHRDMKSSNILLNENFKAVLTDFGMARIMDIDSTHVSTIVAGTPGYVPPEYSQTWRATTKGDVYSFGVVLLELLSGKRPTGPHFNGRCGANLIEMTRILVSGGRYQELLDQNVADSGAAQQVADFLALALRCTDAAPVTRPSMLEVVKTLETISSTQAYDPKSFSTLGIIIT